MQAGFSPYALDAPLAPLDDLPRGLWLPGIINSNGQLHPRLDELLQLRQQLLAGDLPTRPAWPLAPVSARFFEKIVLLDLLKYCRYHEEVTDQVLRTMLWHIDRIIDELDVFDLPTAAQRAADAFYAEWREMAEEIKEILRVFDELGDELRFNRWDLTRGLLHSEGWQELVRIRKLLEKLRELRELIQHLGRARASDELDESHQPQVQVMEKVLAPTTVWRETHVPDVPAETRGIKRSGSIARMLPGESLLLRHPRLRLTWFARHAERTLLNYEEDDRVVEKIVVETEVWRQSEKPQPQHKLEMGPMILCVDTSASMQGGSEQVAKAVVLEAMRTAAKQKRRCYVYAFSGPDEVVERELALSNDGLESVIAFLTQTFLGGTDICAPLERAIDRLTQEEWQLADLVIASDGEFGATKAVVDRVNNAKRELGLRVQGILIGDRETIGFLELCNDIFWVKDWRKYGGSGAESPVHSKSLTAMYFPNALRSGNQDA